MSFFGWEPPAGDPSRPGRGGVAGLDPGRPARDVTPRPGVKVRFQRYFPDRPLEYLLLDNRRDRMTLARAIERFLAKHLGGRAERAR